MWSIAWPKGTLTEASGTPAAADRQPGTSSRALAHVAVRCEASPVSAPYWASVPRVLIVVAIWCVASTALSRQPFETVYAEPESVADAEAVTASACEPEVALE